MELAGQWTIGFGLELVFGFLVGRFKTHHSSGRTRRSQLAWLWFWARASKSPLCSISLIKRQQTKTLLTRRLSWVPFTSIYSVLTANLIAPQSQPEIYLFVSPPPPLLLLKLSRVTNYCRDDY